MNKTFKYSVAYALGLISANEKQITSHYYGKVGCACGCRGTHIEGLKGLKRRMNAIAKSGVENAEIDVYDDGSIIISFTLEASDKAWFFTFEKPNKSMMDNFTGLSYSHVEVAS